MSSPVTPIRFQSAEAAWQHFVELGRAYAAQAAQLTREAEQLDERAAAAFQQALAWRAHVSPERIAQIDAERLARVRA